MTTARGGGHPGAGASAVDRGHGEVGGSASEFDVASVLRLQHELYHHIRPAATVRATLTPFLRLLVKRVGGRSAVVFAGEHARIASVRVRYPLAETLDTRYLDTIRRAHERGDWVADERQPSRHARTWRLASYGILALISERPPLPPLLVDALRPVLDTLGEACVAAAERERQLGELQRSQATIAALERSLDAVPDVVVRLDGEGRIAATNRAWRVIAGERVDHALGRAFAEYLAPDPGRERALEAIAEVVAGVRQACHLQDVAWLRADGAREHVAIHLEGLRDASGQTLGCAGTVRDDRERREREAAVQRTQDALSALEREQSELLNALVQHIGSCRRKLDAVSDAAGWTDALDTSTGLDARLDELRSTITSITAGVSALASLDAQQRTGAATVRTFDLEELAAVIGSSERDHAEHAGVTLSVVAEPLRLAAPRSGLTHALRHLVRYGLAQCPPQGRLELALRVDRVGAGTDATLHAELRWPNDARAWTSDAAFDRHLAAALVQRLGGRLELTTEGGPQALLSLALPPQETASELAPPVAPTAVSEASPQASPEAAQRQRVALVVEDNPTNALVMAGMLTHLGLRSVEVGDGSEALSALLEHAPDVVLMDINMPVMDGVAATQAIRRHEQRQGLAAVPIVAVTAHAMPGDEQRYLQAGMNAYLPKPILLTQLAALLEELLGQGGGASGD